MSTLARIYDDKKNSDTDITTRKTYLLGVDELYVETNYNIRDIDQTHVEEFRDAFIAGEHVPPLAVKVTEKGIKIIDGHHRYYGAKLAQEAGYTLRLECKDFVGSEADSVAFMVTSSQGRALLPLERAAAYQRLVNQGLEPAEIAAKVKRSITDVEQHLQLLTVGEPLIEMVKSGEVAATTAVALQREHGVKASSVAQEQMQKAKAAGKKKLTKTDAMPQFSAAQARKLAELIAKHCQAELGEEGAHITLKFETDLQAAELMDVVLIAKEHYGVTQSHNQQTAPAEPENEAGDDLPLLKHEILERSGVEVWACVQAAFKMKHEYTYAESKFAHTWAADSVDHPEHIVVPQDTIQSAQRLIQMHQDEQVIKQWLSEQHDDPELVTEQLNRFTGALTDLRQDHPYPVQDFIKLMEQVNRDCWSNIRMLRQAVREVAGQIKIPDVGENE
ncbi:chromosome partitioning protein ParB [Pantoea sp. PNT01]|uniref:ParB/RepB/Spo0J family partition protein n=1 Tax=Pantoea sp. PNT01 TaxID=2769271 RepID=UPI001784E165|nr:chromosome partitioning protein ParB [Pantoea sp. PNT01]MBD9551581.1 chromosome partitioning protein ParB [Pantoea sp. PNT01]